MKTMMFACATLCVALCAGAQPASDASSPPGSARNSEPGGIPMTQLIAAVSKSTGKKFLIDPRVQGDVHLAGTSPSSVSYTDLLTILSLHGFAAVEGSGVVQVIPDALVRGMPVPLLKERETRPDAEVVTDIIHVKNESAARLVPILRPLVPQFGHFAADTCSNDLVVVDRFANVRRLEAIVQRLDVGEPFKAQSCAEPGPPAPRVEPVPPREPPPTPR
jgi:general secretion pathway protein D